MQGKVDWRELQTTDVEKAKKFYGDLFGWKFEEMEGMDDYWVASVGDEPGVAGITKGQPGVPSNWLLYVLVDDAEATAGRAKRNGGKMAMEPTEIEGVGQIGIFSDPEGAMMGIVQPTETSSDRKDNYGPGIFCWYALHTKNPDQARRFYGEMFGWTTSQDEMGGVKSTTFLVDKYPYAGLNEIPEGAQYPPHWGSSVQVGSCKEATKLAEKLGAKVMMEPFSVGVGTNSVILDPTGASISLFESDPKAMQKMMERYE